MRFLCLPITTCPPSTAPRAESRVRPSSVSHCSSPSHASATSKFLVIEPNDEEKTLNKLTPFEIEREIDSNVGRVVSVMKLRSGALLTEVHSEQQASDLLKLDTFASCPIKTSTHRTMNSCKGVVKSQELSETSRDELLENLSKQGVTDVKQIMFTQNGEKKKSRTMILTFSTRTPPDQIKAGYSNVAVEQYIPAPLRCFSCQKFGHHQSVSRERKVCAKCGLDAHGDEEPCDNPTQCVNCKGDHPAFAKSCPAWVTEQQICKVKAALNVSHAEAKKRVQTNQTQTSGMLYSAALTSRPETRSIGTQMDDTTEDTVSQSTLIKRITRTIETQTETAKPMSPKKISRQDQRKVGEKGGSHKGPADRPRPASTGSRGDKPTLAAGRPPKGSQDAVRCANRFETLEDLQMEGISASEHGKPARRSSGGDKPPRTKINFP